METALTVGAVHQYTRSKADLYMGGDSTGVNTARNMAHTSVIDQPITQHLNLEHGLPLTSISTSMEPRRVNLCLGWLKSSLAWLRDIPKSEYGTRI